MARGSFVLFLFPLCCSSSLSALWLTSPCCLSQVYAPFGSWNDSILGDFILIPWGSFSELRISSSVDRRGRSTAMENYRQGETYEVVRNSWWGEFKWAGLVGWWLDEMNHGIPLPWRDGVFFQVFCQTLKRRERTMYFSRHCVLLVQLSCVRVGIFLWLRPSE